MNVNLPAFLGSREATITASSVTLTFRESSLMILTSTSLTVTSTVAFEGAYLSFPLNEMVKLVLPTYHQLFFRFQHVQFRNL